MAVAGRPLEQMPYGGDATTFPLHAAAAEGRLAELAAQLTALGADLAKPKQQLAAVAAAVAERDGGGLTVLHRAAQCTDPEGAALDGVRLLIAAGANVAATTGGPDAHTPLHTAAESGPDDAALAGLLMGADSRGGKGKGGVGWVAAHALANSDPDIRPIKARIVELLQAVVTDPKATLAPCRAEAAALKRLVRERGLEAGLAAALSEEERLAAVRQRQPRYNGMLKKQAEELKKVSRLLGKAAAAGLGFADVEFADVISKADLAMKEGTRICVYGRGQGAYASFDKKTFGANEHTIAFDSGETVAVKLQNEQFTVREDQMRLLFDRKALAALGRQLYEPARHGDVAVIERLAAEGASPNATNLVGTPAVVTAAVYGRAEAVAALAELGADLDATDKAGLTALMRAAWWGKVDVVRVLLERGANRQLVGKSGWAKDRTALEIAEEVVPARRKPELVAMLAAQPSEQGSDRGGVE